MVQSLTNDCFSLFGIVLKSIVLKSRATMQFSFPCDCDFIGQATVRGNHPPFFLNMYCWFSGVKGTVPKEHFIPGELPFIH